MAIKTVRVVFPKDLIQEPVIFTAGKLSGVTPAITSARITEESAEFVLELQGTDEQVDTALRFFEERGTVSAVNPGENPPDGERTQA